VGARTQMRQGRQLRWALITTWSTAREVVMARYNPVQDPVSPQFTASQHSIPFRGSYCGSGEALHAQVDVVI